MSKGAAVSNLTGHFCDPSERKNVPISRAGSPTPRKLTRGSPTRGVAVQAFVARDA
jgi:hypothetical protein